MFIVKVTSNMDEFIGSITRERITRWHRDDDEQSERKREASSHSHDSFAGQRARPLYAAFRERLLFFHFLFVSYMFASRRKRNSFKARRLSRRYARRRKTREKQFSLLQSLPAVAPCLRTCVFVHGRHRAISRGQLDVCVLRESRSSCRLIFTRDWVSLSLASKVLWSIVSRFFFPRLLYSRVDTRCNTLLQCCSYDRLLHFCDALSEFLGRLRIADFGVEISRRDVEC